MTELEPHVVYIILLPLVLYCGGCRSQLQNIGASGASTKISALDDALRTSALISVRRETHFFGAPLHVHYAVTIEPRISSGYVERSRSDAFSVSNIRVSTSYVYALETIHHANVATVFEVVLGADHDIRTGIVLFQWDGKRWLSEETVALEELRKTDPRQALEIERMLGRE